MAKKDSPIKLKQDADAAEKAGRFEKAIDLLKQIVADNPRDWNTVNRIGDLYDPVALAAEAPVAMKALPNDPSVPDTDPKDEFVPRDQKRELPWLQRPDSEWRYVPKPG